MNRGGSERPQGSLVRDPGFHALAEAIPAPVVVLNSDLRPIYVNRRWQDYFGIAAAEADRTGWCGTVHPEDSPLVTERWSSSAPLGQPFEAECRVIDRNGQTRWHLVRAVPIRDDENKVVRWFGTHTDITEHRKAREALVEAERHKDQFLSVLAHELRNPLAPMRSAVDIMSQCAPSDPLLARACGIIERQVTHMAHLIDDLLDVSRIARGQIQLRLTRCNLAGIVRRTIEDYSDIYDRLDVELTSDTPEEVWVRGDCTRLNQMLGNLLNNAANFTDSGGRVHVHVEADPIGNVALVSVHDTGTGIDRALLTRLFEPFTQAGPAPRDRHGGLGLGLTLVKELAELHGGSIKAESEGPGQGSTFTIQLPLASPQDVAEKAESAAPSPRSLRVTLVEDNTDAAELLQSLLELMEHEVRVAHDAESGLSLVRRMRPDVVLSDIGLPGRLDGCGLARAVRSDPDISSTYLIALTGYGQHDDRQRTSEAGFDAHLVKPAEYHTLRRLLEQVPPRR